jgi:hypothetical protein
VAALRKVISGGQTGVDRGALEAAREAGLEIGGWCPPGRASESGPIPPDLPLVETPEERSPEAPQVPRSLRSEWNVRDADATLVLRPAGDEPDPGTDWTLRCAERLGRPVLVVDPEDPAAPTAVARWIAAHRVQVLNVAGPSEGTCPRIGRRHDGSSPRLLRAASLDDS